MKMTSELRKNQPKSGRWYEILRLIQSFVHQCLTRKCISQRTVSWLTSLNARFFANVIGDSISSKSRLADLSCSTSPRSYHGRIVAGCSTFILLKLFKGTLARKKCTCYFGQIPQKIINRKISSIHFTTKLSMTKELSLLTSAFIIYACRKC